MAEQDGDIAAPETPPVGKPPAEEIDTIITHLSSVVTRCAPGDEAAELCKQLQTLQSQVKFLAANQASNRRGSSRRESDKKKKKKKAFPDMPVQLGLKSPGQQLPFAPGPGMIQMLIVEDDPFQVRRAPPRRRAHSPLTLPGSRLRLRPTRS